MSDKLKNILSQTECPSTDKFYNYIENKSSKAEKYAFEEHLNTCEFCQEALEGFSTADKAFVLSSLDDINSKIDNRIKKQFSVQYITAAASILIALFFGSIYLLNNTIESEELSVVPETTDGKLNEDILTPEEILEEINEDKNFEVEEELAFEKNIINKKLFKKELSENDVPESKSVKDIEIVKQIDDVAFNEINETLKNVEIHSDYYNDDEMGLADVGDNDLPQLIEELESTEEVIEVASTSALPARSVSEINVSANKYDSPSIDFESLLAYANDEINSQLEKTVDDDSKKSKQNSYSSNNESISYVNENKKVLLELLDQVSGSNSMFLLEKTRLQQLKDVWTNDEQSTLKWLECISMLKLNLSVEEELKFLKKNKNPYQDEAKKLYNDLY